LLRIGIRGVKEGGAGGAPSDTVGLDTMAPFSLGTFGEKPIGAVVGRSDSVVFLEFGEESTLSGRVERGDEIVCREKSRRPIEARKPGGVPGRVLSGVFEGVISGRAGISSGGGGGVKLMIEESKSAFVIGAEGISKRFPSD